MSDLKSRMNLLVSTFETLFPNYAVSRSYEDLSSVEDDYLAAGIFTFLLDSEGDYDNTLYERAANSSQRIVCIARAQFNDYVSGVDIENTEIDMLESIKTFINSPSLPADLQNINLLSARLSGQQENPLAWVITELEITD